MQVSFILGRKKKTTRSRVTAETWEKFLDFAEEEFAVRGFEKASFNSLIERSGISKGSIYHRYANKTDVLRAIVKRTARRFAPLVPDFPQIETIQDFENYVRLLTGLVGKTLMTDPSLAKIIQIAMKDPDPLLRFTRDQIDTGMKFTIRLLEAGQKVGAVRTDLPVELLASASLGMGQGMDRWFLQNFSEVTPERHIKWIDGCLAMFFGAMRPPKK